MLAQAIVFALTMGSTMVLARLLAPADFGLVAMVMTIGAFLRTFKAAGLSSATIQRDRITHAQVSNLFWLNLALGLAAAICLAATAPAIAWFFREPRLAEITLALAATFPLEAAATQHAALLNRQMRFTALAGIQIASTTAGLTVGVGLAWWDHGYWALVWLQLATAASALALTWLVSGWRPQLPVRASGTRPLVAFGASLTASSLVYSLAAAADSLLLGRFHGAGPVGLYTRAAALLRRPVDQLLAPVNAVFIPVLSRLQSEPLRYRRTFLHVHDSVVLLSLSGSALCFALARPFTLVVLGPAWSEAAPIVAAFSVAIVVTPLASTCSWLLETQGRGGDALRTSLWSSLLAIGSFAAGLPWGATGVAAAYALSALLLQLPLFYCTAGRTGPVTAADLRAGFLRHAALWPMVAVPAFLTRTAFGSASPLLQLTMGAAAGAAAGAAFVAVHPASRQRWNLLRTTLADWLRDRRAAAAAGLPVKQAA